MKFSDVVQKLGQMAGVSSLHRNPTQDPELSGIQPVDEAEAGTLSYIEGGKFSQFLETTAASALILPKDEALQQRASARKIAWIEAESPRLLFAHAIALFYQPFRPKPGIHPTAVIDPAATIGANVSIGAHAAIAAGVTLGEGVCLFPNVVIYPDVTIGDRTLVHANATIEERTQIGTDCVIHSGAVIGGEGFGFVASPQGLFKMEQSGYVVLGNGVEVGCNSTIDRPSTGTTRVADNTKIDNLVQIGHGCQIGSNCTLSAQVGLSGKVMLDDRVILAGQVGIANDVRMGKGAIATAQTGIHKDVNPGEIVSGTPATAHKIYLTASAIYNRLPEMYKTVRQLRKKFNLS